MATRCPFSRPIGTASVAGYKFLINDHGYASIIAAPGRIVLGLLWDLDERDEKGLDRYEGVVEGLYRKVTLSVKPAEGSLVDALVYIACSNRPGIPRRGYLENILQAASKHGFPPNCLEEMKSWLGDRKEK